MNDFHQGLGTVPENAISLAEARAAFTPFELLEAERAAAHAIAEFVEKHSYSSFDNVWRTQSTDMRYKAHKGLLTEKDEKTWAIRRWWMRALADGEYLVWASPDAVSGVIEPIPPEVFLDHERRGRRVVLDFVGNMIRFGYSRGATHRFRVRVARKPETVCSLVTEGAPSAIAASPAQGKRLLNASKEQVREAVRQVYPSGEPMPNLDKAWKPIRAKLNEDGRSGPREFIQDVLKEDEFSKQRASAGNPHKT